MAEKRPVKPAASKAPAHPHSVLVVDDSPTLRENLCAWLERRPSVRVVGIARDGREALVQAEALKPDLVLMDVQMPLMGGLEATTHLRRLFPGARIILMSLQDSPSIQRAAFARGAHGFVGKTRIMDELMPEIERVFGLKPADEAPPAS